MKRRDGDFPQMLTDYFKKYLAGMKNASPNTIRAYRDTFMLLILFLQERRGIPAEKMSLNQFSRELIEEYLNYLEETRDCSISTRNQRLAAIKSFFRYAKVERPDELLLCQQILSIEARKGPKPTVQYLDSGQIEILLDQPDISAPRGRRDLALILLLYDSAARVQEICDLKVCDLKLSVPPVVRLYGKGRKSRNVPLTKPCADVLQRYVSENHLDRPERQNEYLFVNPQRKQLSRSGVAYIISKYISCANRSLEHGLPNISPHCLRHSKAMHMLEAGTNLVYIRDFLGHESVETTEVYAKANPEARRKAMEKMEIAVPTSTMPDWNDNADIMAFLRDL